ncbi:MAG: hypothetical protein ACQCN5_02675 [Candidatus Bathyarchaeia archaeon]|jgi:hypothetical protein
MKKSKMFGALMICLFSFFFIFSVNGTSAFDGNVYSGMDKLQAVLSDVFGLDLSKYSIVDPSSAINYEYGGSVEVEGCSFKLVDAKGGVITVRGHFYNGYPHSVSVRLVDGSFYFVVEPPRGSVGELQAVFERYMAFAQKYDIATVDMSVASDLFSKVPSSLPASALSSVDVSLDNWMIHASKKSIGFSYLVDGVEVPNKSLRISYETDRVTLYDCIGLYSVSEVNVFSEEEFEGFAFDLAQKFCGSFFSEDVKVDWSGMRSEIGFNLVPGRIYDNPINNELLEQGTGVKFSKDRDALTLYPMWTGVFYFGRAVGNVVGVQVGVWGDSGEVAYCYEYGHLGSSSPYPTEDVSASDSVNPADDSLLWLLFVVVLSIAVASIAAVAVFVKRVRK